MNHRYYVCSRGIATSIQCPAGLLFNRAISSCDFEGNVECHTEVWCHITMLKYIQVNNAISTVCSENRKRKKTKKQVSFSAQRLALWWSQIQKIALCIPFVFMANAWTTSAPVIYISIPEQDAATLQKSANALNNFYKRIRQPRIQQIYYSNTMLLHKSASINSN